MFLTLFKMKKIYIQLQVEETPVHRIMDQLKRFVRCIRYFMVAFTSYVAYNIFNMSD